METVAAESLVVGGAGNTHTYFQDAEEGESHRDGGVYGFAVGASETDCGCTADVFIRTPYTVPHIVSDFQRIAEILHYVGKAIPIEVHQHRFRAVAGVVHAHTPSYAGLTKIEIRPKVKSGVLTVAIADGEVSPSRCGHKAVACVETHIAVSGIVHRDSVRQPVPVDIHPGKDGVVVPSAEVRPRIAGTVKADFGVLGVIGCSP